MLESLILKFNNSGIKDGGGSDSFSACNDDGDDEEEVKLVVLVVVDGCSDDTNDDAVVIIVVVAVAVDVVLDVVVVLAVVFDVFVPFSSGIVTAGGDGTTTEAIFDTIGFVLFMMIGIVSTGTVMVGTTNIFWTYNIPFV